MHDCGCISALVYGFRQLQGAINAIIKKVWNYGKYYEVRITILGMKNSGKSTLVNVLRGEYNKDTIPTLDIDVTNVELNRTDDGNWLGPVPYKSDLDNEADHHKYIDGYIRSLITGNKVSKSLRSLKSANTNDYEENNSAETTPLINSKKSRFNNNNFQCDSPITINENTLSIKKDETGESGEDHNMDRLMVKIYDLSGQARKHYLWKDFISEDKSDCIIYVIDLSDEITLDASKRKCVEMLEFNETHDNLPFLVVGSKSDLAKWDKPPFSLKRNSCYNASSKDYQLRHWLDPDNHFPHTSCFATVLCDDSAGDVAQKVMGWATSSDTV